MILHPEIFNSGSIKFGIGGKDTKAAKNQNTAGKYSCSVFYKVNN
jgi:hypothetical protein